jgi:histidyl-tRNA synthetase
MKKTLLLLPVLALLFVACSFETTEKAIEYNDEMIAIQSEVDQSLVDLLDAIDTFDPVEMEAARIETLDLIEESIDEVEDMREFDKKDDFKKEMTKLLKMYQDITENELTEVIDLVGYSDELSDSDWDNYDNLYEEALDKYNDAFDAFNEWQEGFAKEWDFEVAKND